MNDGEKSHRWVAQQKWFHALDLGGGLISKGRFAPSRPPNYTLYGVLELLSRIQVQGFAALDVGTMDGLVSLGLKQRGAAHVIATDLAPRATFEFARERLGLDVDYRVPVSAVELPEMVGHAKVDLLVMAGVLYHVLDPLSALFACRRTLKRHGLLVLESSYLFNEGRPYVAFNPADTSGRGIQRDNVFWRATEAAMVGMVQLVGFEVLATVAVDARMTILARAERPSELSRQVGRIASIQKRYHRYANYQESLDYADLEKDDSAPSSIRYSGPLGRQRLYPTLSRPDAPFLPHWAPPTRTAMLRGVSDSAVIHARAESARWRAQAVDSFSRALQSLRSANVSTRKGARPRT